VRVNASGCLGACEEGIAAVCYGSKGGAQWHWGLDPTPESAEILFKSLESISSKSDLDPRNHES
jgi:(2Fe-2S) ferredoxin